MITIVCTLLLLVWFFLTRSFGLREAFLRAATIAATFLLIATEVLSPFRLITRTGLQLAWMVFAVCVAVLVLAAKKEARPPSRNVSWALLLPLLTVLATTLALALLAEPNNWDSMTYHMARVANWAQNASVAPYPTHITRQLVLGPWAEFAILHLYVLSDGSDRWANMVQWMSFAGCSIAVSLILRELKVSHNVQMIGALLVCTTPMLILQSTSTQNDLVCALWLSAFVFFSSRPRVDWTFAVLALSLAISTKPTAMLFAPPFVMMALFREHRTAGTSAVLRKLAAGLAVGLLLNAGYFMRNLEIFGHPLGDPALAKSVNMRVHDPVHIGSNVVRNLALHMGTPVGRVTWAIERSIVRAHERLNLDSSDPRTTWGVFHIPPTSGHEDDAGNLILMYLTCAAFFAAFINRKQFPDTWYFGLQIGTGFLLFCAVLKWQPWHSRLHVPVFVLAAGLVAAAFGQIARLKRLGYPAAIFIFIACLPWLVFNRSRPLVAVPVAKSFSPTVGTWRSVAGFWLPKQSVLSSTREHQLFANQPDLEIQYDQGVGVAMANGCHKLGLVVSADSWEYPVHYLARQIDRSAKIFHVFVANPSGHIPSDTAGICSILVIKPPMRQTDDWPSVPVSKFTAVWESESVRVMKRRSPVDLNAI